ncbi:uncharacterized protein LOC111392284 isoform X1 [Olea europaea var. sylvestris]|uniref:uncharacterized protein LOC111392284 isoform X1 n=1 Tax=Olea europaea var. sylvestris TaxID=158386 RepID=UPI000C1D28CC|nr:uncharacterized protein LOC111392284 isoform X1 [Olea europaea var. sylvestris]XP_022873359.1 uncharacterized protein LOC111392284 isoform X1 [Olea europaea var. sylvestris]
MKLCRTGFSLNEDSVLEDNRDAIPVDDESSGSSDEAEQMGVRACYNVSSTTDSNKRKSSSEQRRGRKKKMSAHELSFSVVRATSATEEVMAKIHTMMTSNKSAGVNCVKELLATGRLERCTPFYFYICQFLAHKQYSDMLAIMRDADEKFEWIEWMLKA